MATISTPNYLIDQAIRRIKPTPSNLPGMGLVEQRLRAKKWDEFVFAEPPAGSGLKAIKGEKIGTLVHN